MISSFRRSYFYCFLISGILVGLCFPIIFAFLDLRQLGLEITFLNMHEVFLSQNIYTFSAVLFPVLFGTVSGLFFHTFSQNKKLSEQETYINNILNSLNDCILVCDNTGKIQYANKIFYETYEANINFIIEILGISNLDNASKNQANELSIITKSYENRTINYYISNTNIINTYIISIRDVEDLKKKENIIESQKAQLFEASKLSALGQMASGFAHEINNPLAIMNGKLTQLEREIKKDHFRMEYIENCIDINKKMIQRVTKIIKGLRTLAHADVEKTEVLLVKDLIEDFIIMANLRIAGKGINLKVESDSVNNEQITCNFIQISQVLMNLFNNAIDEIENDESPWFLIKIEMIKNEFKWTIQDSGKGIPLRVQQKMFEPMYTTKAIGKGTGLGLSISRAIIEKHHGRILINNSCPNTCFEFYLPAEIKLSSVA